MSTNYWGPKTWKTLHCITYIYPTNPSQEVKKNYIYFFNYTVPGILPCPICQKHFLKHLRDRPIYNHISSKESLCKWLIDVHNYVNRSNRKRIITYEEANQLYNNKIYLTDINQIVLFHRKRVQYRTLNPMVFNKFMYFLNLTIFRLVPANNNGIIEIK